MKEGMTVKIPIERYLKKFVANKHEVEPMRIKLGKNNYIPDYIYSTMTTYSHKLNTDVKLPDYNDCLEVIVPCGYVKQQRWFVNKKSVLKLHRFLNSCFEDRLDDFIEYRRTETGRRAIRKNIILFFSIYGIHEDDLSLDTAVKKYYRYKKAKEKRARRKKIVSTPIK